MTLTSCEDVPAPYEIFSQGGEEEKTTLIDETFASSLGSFTSIATTGSFDWACSYSSAQISAYDSDTKKNNNAMSWLVSSAVDTKDVESAHISFDYILRYATESTLSSYHQLLISKDWDGTTSKITSATWQPLDFYLVQGTDWNTWYTSGSVNVPTEFLGGTLYVALRYQADESKAGTWEVKNFLMETGAGDYDPTEQGGGNEGSGDTYALTNVIKDGTYLIATNVDGTYKVATNLSSTSSYGWVYTEDATDTDGVINTASSTSEWTFKTVDGGYTIQDSYSRYIYMSGTYNSFNVSESLPAEGGVWTVSPYKDGTVAIKNVAMSKTIQYSSSYSSYGAYSSVSSALPSLFLKGATAKNIDTTAPEYTGDSGSGDSGSGNTGNYGSGDGTKDNPYTTMQVVKNVYADGDTTKGVWVHGYIVGYIGSGGISSTSFNASASVQTNIVIADNASETDYNNCVAVQLPSGSVRTALNLKDNSDNYKKEVWLYGDVIKYCSGPGLKNTSDYKLGEGSASSDSGNSGDAATSYTYTFTDSQGDWTIDNKKIDSALSAVWKQNTSYGMVASAYANSTCYETEAWLISPALDFSKMTAPTLTFNNAGNKFGDQDTFASMTSVQVSTDNGATWTALTTSNSVTGAAWTFVDATADLSAYAGKSSVKIAFKYTSSSSVAGSWEIKTVTIK